MKFSLFKFKKRESVRQPREPKRRADPWISVFTFAISAFGLLMVYDSSVAIAIRDFQNPYYFLWEQSKWLLLGLGVFSLFSLINYKLYAKFAFALFLITILLLIAVLIPGFGIKALGARRWLDFQLFILQPAELAKLTLIIYLSALFAKAEKPKLLNFMLITALLVGLVILEPDLGTTIILVGIAMLLYFLAGAPIWQFLLTILLAIVALGLLAVTSPYRLSRLTSYLNPEKDPLGSSYQVRQATLAIGSGGWLGVGIGKSRQKYEYLPEANTDSIFAIIAEETGFYGCLLLILGYLFLFWRGFRLANRVTDPFGRFVALGISSWLALQVAINLAANVALIPLTGIPLPLISYGGSSLVIILTGLGILTNISKHA